MDELYNEVCDIIQEQYNNGELTEEDATTLMEAAYDRYVVERLTHGEKKSIKEKLKAKANEYDSLIKKQAAKGKFQEAINTAKEAVQYFTKVEQELHNDLKSSNIGHRIAGVAGAVGGIAGSVGRHKVNGKYNDELSKINRKQFDEVFNRLDERDPMTDPDFSKTLKDFEKIGDKNASAVADLKKSQKKENVKNNIVILGSTIALTASVIAELKSLPMQIKRYKAHFSHIAVSLRKKDKLKNI